MVSIALSFLTIELYVRTFVDDGLNYELEMWKYAKLMKQVSDDPNIGHEHRPNTDAHLMGVDVATNSAKVTRSRIHATQASEFNPHINAWRFHHA